MPPRAPRIAVLGLHLEANAFAPPTLREDFEKQCWEEGERISALARLVSAAAGRTQIVVVTHSAALVDALELESPDAVRHELVKDLGETRVADQGLLTRPTWDWGSR